MVPLLFLFLGSVRLPKDRLRMMAKHWSEGREEQWDEEEKEGREEA